jgi:hypothetical protein
MKKGPRRIGVALLCLAASLTLYPAPRRAAASAQPDRLPPTPLEVLAAQPDAKTKWSKWIGRLDGRTAYATVSAVVIDSARSTPRVLRGVRIDLRHEGLRPSCNLSHVEWAVMCDREQAAAFIEEDRLASFIAAIPRQGAALHPGYPSGVVSFSSVLGPGVIIGGYKLYGRTLGELAALVDAASRELKAAPFPAG